MLFSFASALFVTLVTLQDWARADEYTKRLPPSAFSNLPALITADLERRGCIIPQSFAATTPENVIRGAFTRSGVMDWAVLCSVRRTSAILIYREGSVDNVDRLARLPDSTFLQVVSYDGRGNPVIGYSRLVEKADAQHIMADSRVGSPF